MADNERNSTDQILDLLLDALAERQARRQDDENAHSDPGESQPEHEANVVNRETVSEDTPLTAVTNTVEDELIPTIEAERLPEWQEPYPVEEVEEDEYIPEIIPEKLPSINLEKMLFQLSAAVFIIIIVINIPFNRFGTNLARAMPDEQAIVVRDGLVIKGSGDEIYVIENNQKRWISSLDAFDYFGFRWQQVNEVDDDFLSQFEDGRPLHVLLKCNSSPHVYALEDGEKRWINNIVTFENEGYVWEDVKFVSCGELSRIPDGLPIPVDAGEPPQP